MRLRGLPQGAACPYLPSPSHPSSRKVSHPQLIHPHLSHSPSPPGHPDHQGALLSEQQFDFSEDTPPQASSELESSPLEGSSHVVEPVNRKTLKAAWEAGDAYDSNNSDSEHCTLDFVDDGKDVPKTNTFCGFRC